MLISLSYLTAGARQPQKLWGGEEVDLPCQVVVASRLTTPFHSSLLQGAFLISVAFVWSMPPNEKGDREQLPVLARA